MNSFYWSEKDVSFLRENYQIYGSQYCSKILNRARSSIVCKANKIGLFISKELWSKLKCKPYHLLDIPVDNFSVNITPESAYVLGILWADGSVEKSGKVRIGLVKQDMNDIECVFDKLGKWKKRDKQLINRQLQRHIGTNSKILSNFLQSHNYISKSTSSADSILSIIPDNLKHYWFRGLFDGDGHIRKNRNEFSISSNYYQDWTYLIELSKKFGMKYHVRKQKLISKAGKEHSSSCFSCSHAMSMYKFFEFIYFNYENDNIGLKRKYKEWINRKSLFIEKSKHENWRINHAYRFLV